MNDTASERTQPHLLPHEGIRRVLMAIFAAAGAAATEAKAIADNLVEANLAGHDSHGIARVPRYLDMARRGLLRFGQSTSVVLDGGAFVLLEGHHGFGQVLGGQAVEAGLEKARAHGVSLVALRNAGHLGRIGAWAEQACAAGFVSIHFVNVAGSNLVAPFGGAGRRMSTAPVTIGIPNPTGDDFLLDFATSKVAEGKVLVALTGGKPPPEGALIDGQGRLTQDPLALYGDIAPGEVPNPRAGPGALVAMGDHKGSGLALACELLAGCLIGSGTAADLGKAHNGMFSIYLSPSALDDGHGWAPAVNDFIAHIRACPPADPAKPVLVPGDPERASRRARRRDGLPLPPKTWEAILAAGIGAGLERTDLLATLDAEP